MSKNPDSEKKPSVVAQVVSAVILLAVVSPFVVLPWKWVLGL